MDFSINIKDRSKVTTESVNSFLRELVDKNFISSKGIEWISYDHYEPEINDRVGESFDPGGIDEAISIITKKGVEFLGIGFNYTGHYHLDNRPENIDHLSKIMYCLNIASAEVAEKFDAYTSIDFYLSVTFASGLYHTEWGDMEMCKFNFGGEGGDIDEKNIEEAIALMESVMTNESPELFSLLEIMRANFGDADFGLEYNEF